MGKSTPAKSEPSRIAFDQIEEFARQHVQSWLQALIEDEVTDFLGRIKSERLAAVDGWKGYRNGSVVSRRVHVYPNGALAITHVDHIVARFDAFRREVPIQQQLWKAA